MKTGLPMGGPVSALASRLVIDHILDWTFARTGLPSFHKVYVDDSIFVLNKSKVIDMLDTLNSFTSSIKFTIEWEENSEINFLNMTLYRRNDHIITNWFRKPYASKRILNYHSSHKRSTILNTATHFIHTVVQLSDVSFFQYNKNKVIDTLKYNNFPETLILTLMNDNYTLMRPLSSEKRQENRDKRYVSYPHTIKNAGLKNIIRDYALPDVVLSESVKNTKINFTQKIKKPNELESVGNVIATSICACGKRSKADMTKFNENGATLMNRLKTNRVSCTQNWHAHQKVSLHKGMHYKGQTAYLLKQIRWKNRSKSKDPLDFPVKHLRNNK